MFLQNLNTYRLCQLTANAKFSSSFLNNKKDKSRKITIIDVKKKIQPEGETVRILRLLKSAT